MPTHIQALRELLGDRVVTDPTIAAGYAADAYPQATSLRGEEFTVVRARRREDVVSTLRYAAEQRVPVVPQGARTATTGAACALPGAIVLSTELMTAVEIDPVERIAVVGPGVINTDLKAAAAEHGLAYPPDPASSSMCTVGGNIATNAGGLCCVKYGVTADYVRGLEVVLPGGEVMRTGRRTAKGVAGYELTGLFVGSEGTLGVVTEAVLRLIPLGDPALTALAVFPTLDATIAGIAALRGTRHTPSLIEMLDGPSIDAVQAYGDYGFPVGSGGVLLVQSDRPGHAEEDVREYAALLGGAGATDVAVADDRAEADLLMEGRRVLNPALKARGSRFIEDVCVPVGRLGELVRQAQLIAGRHGLEATCSGHAGDGNLHPCFFYDDTDALSLAAAQRAFDELVRAAWALGGTVTGEHGVGEAKAPWLAEELGEAEMARQRALKALFDPLGIMNPGRVYS
ncbi:MAG: FAD-linked oxidase C-terminal domain-containing protein [Ornithinimicrobium sp.]|uniref:FAD-binding oxidoreductase n=1 Tax=Ornithinimicrobium sp. TaxID=1977084 RepID=UPI0026DFF9D7|nr:FAD-linked oxidase C-terminal domain-containing protein [Ornithinimicrobium sp.]MDO5738962.1 FAD-linked oxidase C-terminal domain-containing protein [Ornithinimicrobium sp.]